MQGMLIEYLERQTASFDDAPFSGVDSLVLSTISYFHFEEGMLGAGQSERLVPLAQAICGIPYPALIGSGWLKNYDGRGFLAALLQSPRFMSLQVSYYIDEFSDAMEKQFEAITFFFPDGCAYAAFRGTDNSLAGWKEDFNLSFMEGTPGQVAARAYVERLARLTIPMIYVGGHSKGGNLAEYAAITCNPQAYKKVARVYNHDGPSFCTDVAPRMGTIDYRNRLHKTVPESSIFGMLMERRADYRVVKARGALMDQHAPLNWTIEGDDFVDAHELSSNAVVIGGTLTKWAYSYPPEKREYFVDNVFDVLRSAGIHSWSEVNEDTFSYVKTIFEEAAKTDATTRQAMFGMLGDAFGILRNNAWGKAREKLPGPPRLPGKAEQREEAE